MSRRLDRGHRALLKDILRIERENRDYRPTARDAEPPRCPSNADEVLAAVALKYKPGDSVGLRHVLDCIDISWENARAVRDWARHPSVGAWPWLQPMPSRPAGGRRKRGAS